MVVSGGLSGGGGGGLCGAVVVVVVARGITARTFVAAIAAVSRPLNTWHHYTKVADRRVSVHNITGGLLKPRGDGHQRAAAHSRMFTWRSVIRMQTFAVMRCCCIDVLHIIISIFTGRSVSFHQHNFDFALVNLPQLFSKRVNHVLLQDSVAWGSGSFRNDVADRG